MYTTTTLPVTGSGAALVGASTGNMTIAIYMFFAAWTIIAAFQVAKRMLPTQEV